MDNIERRFRVISESEVYNRTKDKVESLKLNDEYIILREDVFLEDAGAWKCENIVTKDVVLIPHWYCYNSLQEITPAEEILKQLLKEEVIRTFKSNLDLGWYVYSEINLYDDDGEDGYIESSEDITLTQEQYDYIKRLEKENE